MVAGPRTVSDGVGQAEDTTLGLCLITHVELLLAHAQHGPANRGVGRLIAKVQLQSMRWKKAMQASSASVSRQPTWCAWACR